MVITGHEINSDTTISTDFVIVGSGAGGATAAHLISRAGRDVVILEEGGYFKTEDFNDNIKDLIGVLYRDAGMTPIYGKPNIPFGEGCCVGGSTVINGGLCWRTPKEILQKWSDFYGLPLLDEENMEGIFSKIENDLGISVQKETSANKASQKIINGCERLNWKYEFVPRAQLDCKNSNRCPTGCPNEAKQSMLLTYLPDAVENGAKIYSNVRAEKLDMEGDRAIGIVGTLKKKDKEYSFRVKAKNVILAGGAMQTPFFLLKNGFKKNIGNNLQIHLNIKVAAVFNENIDPHLGTIMTAQVKEFARENIFIGSSNFDPVYLALTLSGHGNKTIDRVIHDWKRTGIFLAQIKCSGSGKVTDKYVGRPVPSYNLVPKDIEKVKIAIEKLVEVLLAAGAREIYLPIAESPVIRSMEDVNSLLSKSLDAKDLEIITVHAMSTCPMGEDKKISAVDPFGKLHGTENVYLSDASILPEATGVNPQVTIMAMAHRNMNHLLENEKGNS